MLLVVGPHNCPNKVENRTFRDLEYTSIAFLVMAVKSLCSFVILYYLNVCIMWKEVKDLKNIAFRICVISSKW